MAAAATAATDRQLPLSPGAPASNADRGVLQRCEGLAVMMMRQGLGMLAQRHFL